MKSRNLAAALVIAAVATAIGAVVGAPGSGRAAASGPTSSAAPTISGTAQEGQSLATTNGAWSGTPTSYSYVWSRCDANGSSCAAISGATAAAYKAVGDDVTHTLRVTVTAKNATGSGAATSAPSAVVSSTDAPTPTKDPTISGTPSVGSTLTASEGAWSGNPTSVAVAWLRCDANGNACAAVAGASGAAYAVTQADAGRTLRVSVTETNGKGSTTFASTQTAAVPGSTGCPAGTGVVQVGSLAAPARLDITQSTLTPTPVTLSTLSVQLNVLVTACNGRPVAGALVYATPIPFNQFAGIERMTGADGTVTLVLTRERGFPARRRNQHLLAVFIRARKPGDPLLGGISTRRTVAFEVRLP